MVAAFLNSGVRLVFPFLNRTLFLWLLGPEYLGLNGLFGSILGMLMLAELGFGIAVISSMYKPVADDDHELVCAYLAFYRTIYRWVGAAVFTIGLCLMPFLRQLVHGEVPADINLHVLYFIHLVNVATSYFLFAYRGSVLGVHARKDVITHIGTCVSVAQYITVFLILFLTRNYYYYVIATVAFTVVQNLSLYWASNKLFPHIQPFGKLDAARRRAVVSDVKAVFMHKIGGVVTNFADNLVISSFLGLVAVAAYGNYYYVLTSVGGLVAAVYSSMLGGFGNKIHTESKEDNFRLFMKANHLVLTVAMWCAAMMAALYQPFISVWTRDNPQLARHALTPVLMVLFFYVAQSRQILQTFKTAAALWKADRWSPFVTALLNLGVNIALVLLLPEAYKLDGVIFSTIFSYVLVQIPWETRVLFTKFFDGAEALKYLRMQGVFAAQALAVCALTWAAARVVSLDGVAGLAAKGAVAGAAATALVAALHGKALLGMLRRK